jgi:hypothetical protein
MWGIVGAAWSLGVASGGNQVTGTAIAGRVRAGRAAMIASTVGAT